MTVSNVITALCMTMLVTSCARDGIADPTGEPPKVVRKITDYTFRKVPGSSITLQFRSSIRRS